jgi:hypothetical protein
MDKEMKPKKIEIIFHYDDLEAPVDSWVRKAFKQIFNVPAYKPPTVFVLSNVETFSLSQSQEVEKVYDDSVPEKFRIKGKSLTLTVRSAANA